MEFEFSKRDFKNHFRHRLKQGSTFAWTNELEDAFLCANGEIVSLKKTGVKTYQLGRPTVRVTDWSLTGVGYVLDAVTLELEWFVLAAGSALISRKDTIQ